MKASTNFLTKREEELGSHIYRLKKHNEKLERYAASLRKSKHDDISVAAMQALISRIPIGELFDDQTMAGIVDLANNFADLMMEIKYGEDQ